jgi:tubulin polyglutamylase TTLL9
MLNKMRLYLTSKYGFDKVNNSFGKIQELIIKTMEAVQKVMHTDRNHSFELYGFDVLLDSQFQPWLL